MPEGLGARLCVIVFRRFCYCRVSRSAMTLIKFIENHDDTNCPLIFHGKVGAAFHSWRLNSKNDVIQLTEA